MLKRYVRSLPWRLSFALPMAIGGYIAVVETTASTPREGLIFGGVLVLICLWPGPIGNGRTPQQISDGRPTDHSDAGGGNGDGGEH